MGHEYKIRFAVPPGYSCAALAERLPSAQLPSSAWVAYEYFLDSDGFLFVDHASTDAGAIAFRRLVDEALRHDERVVVEEL